MKRHALSDAQWWRFKQRMGKLVHRDRWTLLLGILPGFAPLALIPFWIRLSGRVALPWRIAFEVTFAVCVLAYVYWLLSRRYRRHGFQALRELGYANLCTRCGYDLSRQPTSEGRCPECGEPFSQFHPDKTWSIRR